MWATVSKVSILSAAAVSINAATGVQACPTAADVKVGLVLRYSDGAETQALGTVGNTIDYLEVGAAEGGGDLHFASYFGLYDLEAGSVVDGLSSAEHSVRYDYGDQVLAKPFAGADPWVGQVTAQFPGDVRVVQTVAYVFGEVETIEVGQCTFASVPVTATFLRPEGWERQDFLYLQDLGIATLVGRADDRHAPVQFTLTGISVEEN